MINYNKAAVIIFAKLPEPGKVKTRLATGIGNNAALQFYKKCSGHIFDQIAALKNKGIDCYLFYGVDNNISDVKKWVNKNFIYNPQSAGDLGNKMSSAFQNVFAHGNNKIIIVGTDIPDISKEIILKAFDELEQNDIVISPSGDGGYNFLGMNNYYPELFQNIKWSTVEVLTKTIEAAESLKLRIAYSESFTDIDDKEDLLLWLAENNLGNISLKLAIKNILDKNGN